MTHNEYWHGVKEEACMRLHKMFDTCNTKLDDIVGDENGVDSFHDAKLVLAWVLRHAENCEERACGILNVCEILHAHHEMMEHVAGATVQ